eukprot:1838681-Amphidinium_carterae.1
MKFTKTVPCRAVAWQSLMVSASFQHTEAIQNNNECCRITSTTSHNREVRFSLALQNKHLRPLPTLANPTSAACNAMTSLH